MQTKSVLVAFLFVACGSSTPTTFELDSSAAVDSSTLPDTGVAFCEGGVCACTLGTGICQGAQALECGADGAMHATIACPTGTVCVAGRCDDIRCPDETDPTLGELALPIHAWPRYRHDNRNSGITTAVVADKPVFVRKTFIGGTAYDSQTGLASGPVIDQNGRIYIGGGELDGKNGAYYAFDPTGPLLFTFLSNRLTGLSTPAVRQDGTSFVASGGKVLFAITGQGQQAWTYSTSLGTDGDPIVTREGTIIYPSEDGAVYAFDPTGKLIWKSDATVGPGEADSAMAQSCDGRIYVGGINGFFALDVVTGKTKWSVPATTQYQAVSASPTVTADGIMYGVDGGGIGYALDPTGKIIWSRALGAAGATSPTHIATLLIVVLNDGKIHALDAATGKEKWAQPVGYTLTRGVGKVAGPVVDGHLRTYINSTDGFVYAFDLTGTLLWKIAASGVAHAQLFSGGIAIGADGTMAVPGNDGYLYLFK